MLPSITYIFQYGLRFAGNKNSKGLYFDHIFQYGLRVAGNKNSRACILTIYKKNRFLNEN